MIQKIIHRIWIGDDDPSPEVLHWHRKGEELLPHWQHKLWTEKELLDIRMTNREMFVNEKNRTCKSDIARAEILYKYGGVYMDLDVEIRRPFDFMLDMFNAFVEFTGTVCQTHNCVIASIAKNRFIEHVIDEYPKWWDDHTSSDHLVRTWKLWHRLILEYPVDIAMLAPGSFCQTKGFEPQDAFCVHHTWSGRHDISGYKPGQY